MIYSLIGRRCRHQHQFQGIALRQKASGNGFLLFGRNTTNAPILVFSHVQTRDQHCRQGQIKHRTIHIETKCDEKTSQNLVSLLSVIKDLDLSAQFNQGKGGFPNGLNSSSSKKWDVGFVRQTIDRYEYFLDHYFRVEGHGGQSNRSLSVHVNEPDVLDHFSSEEVKKLFFSSETTRHAFIAVLRCKLPTHELSRKIREWERRIGNIGITKMTDSLSLSMLEANGKAGNVGRAIQLLSFRKSKNFEPKASEFIYAITAIDAAGLYLRKNRNVFVAERDQPKIDDPTRWLDAILLNMSQRNFALTTPMANRMLNTFARTGKSAKMVHYFYRVVWKPIDDNSMGKNTEDYSRIATFKGRPVKIKIDMRPPPPYHKIPSQVRGKLVKKPGSDLKQLKLEQESDPDWSPVLTSAISFAESLKQGAVGHDPIELDLISYSILVKVCVNRGSLWRAMRIIDEIMPANGIEPDVIAYNTLLIGLSRVGDVRTMKDYTRELLSYGINPNKETVQAVIDSLLNLGDVGTAITICQDYYNQHSVLPPYTTHLKILEMTLGRGLVFEAKRHVSFIQQLWKWKRNKYHSEEFCRIMVATQRNPNLSKEALQNMFAYFGYKLNDTDFFD